MMEGEQNIEKMSKTTGEKRENEKKRRKKKENHKKGTKGSCFLQEPIAFLFSPKLSIVKWGLKEAVFFLSRSWFF